MFPLLKALHVYILQTSAAAATASASATTAATASVIVLVSHHCRDKKHRWKEQKKCYEHTTIIPSHRGDESEQNTEKNSGQNIDKNKTKAEKQCRNHGFDTPDKAEGHIMTVVIIADQHPADSPYCMQPRHSATTVRDIYQSKEVKKDSFGVYIFCFIFPQNICVSNIELIFRGKRRQEKIETSVRK